MDPLFLSRLQFAAATMFHFLFVPLTLGLSILLAVMETRYARSGEEKYLAMTKFWGKLFLINFAMGVVTGITLEFQFAPIGPDTRNMLGTYSGRSSPSKRPQPFSWNPHLSACGYSAGRSYPEKRTLRSCG